MTRPQEGEQGNDNGYGDGDGDETGSGKCTGTGDWDQQTFALNKTVDNSPNLP